MLRNCNGWIDDSLEVQAEEQQEVSRTMVTINATEAHDDIEELWSNAAKEPVTILSAGQAVADVLSPAEFNRLTARGRGAKAGFAKINHAPMP